MVKPIDLPAAGPLLDGDVVPVHRAGDASYQTTLAGIKGYLQTSLQATALTFSAKVVFDAGADTVADLSVFKDQGDPTKKARFDLSGLTPATTRVYGLPDVNTNLVGDDAVATLANKTLINPVLNGSLSGTGLLDEDDMISDAADKAASQQSIKAHVAAEITNLLNAPPAALDTLNELAAALGDDPNFSATMVTALAGKQPLDGDLTALAALAFANGDIIYYDGALKKLAKGSDDDVLTLAAGLPVWAAPGGGGGGWVPLASAVASASASLDFTSLIDGTYDLYRFDFINLNPQNDLADLWVRTDASGGASFDTSGYYFHGTGSFDNNATYRTFGLANGSAIVLNTDPMHVGNAAAESISGQFYLANPADTTFYKHFKFWTAGTSGAATPEGFNTSGGGHKNATEAINAVQFRFDTGDIDTGVVRMSGRKNS